MISRSRIRLTAAAALAALVASLPARDALAVGSTDYTVTATSGLYEPPPSGVPVITDTITTGAMRLDLPFEFSYFGVIHDHVKVTTNGLVYFGNGAGTVPASAVNPLS